MPVLIKNITPDKVAIGNLLLWLKPESLSSYSSGASITSWNDSSGNGYNATSYSTNPNPTYTTNVLTGGQGVSYGAATFTGTGSPATSTTLGINITGGVPNTNFTLFVVRYCTGSTGGFCTGIYKLGLSNGYDWLIDFVYGPARIVQQGTSVQSTFCPTLTLPGTQSYNKWLADSFVVQSSNSATAWSKGVPSTAGAVLTSYGHTNTSLLLGVYDSASGFNNYSGYLMEIIIYNTALTTTQRQDIENYLRLKFQI